MSIPHSSLDNKHLEYPSLVRRVQAMFIDFIVILCIFTIASLIIGAIGEVADSVRAGILIFCFVLYEPLLISSRGGTIGHYLLKMRVKSYQNSERNINFILAILRILFKAALGWVSFLTVTSNEERRAIHDMISGSIVTVRDTIAH